MESIFGIICFIALIAFFVIASNLGTIATQSKAQTKLLGDILSSLDAPPNWYMLVQLAEIEKVKGNIPLALERYKEAKYWLEKKIAESKDKKVVNTYDDRLDSLNKIISKLES
jgi:hypothetical protein